MLKPGNCLVSIVIVLLSAQEEAEDEAFEGGVRLVAEREVEREAALEDGLVVGEGVETGFAVVGAHAAVADAAEGEIRDSEVDNGIVDAATAEVERREESVAG